VEENPETINKLSDELTLLRQKLAQMESLLAEYKKTEKELPQQNKNNRLTSESSIAHQQIEQALRESEEKYRVLFDNEIYAISIFDLETLKILDVNDTFTRLYGYSRTELLAGMTMLNITTESQETLLSIEQTVHKGTAFVPLRYTRKKDGTVFPVELVGGSYFWKERPVMFALLHDITHRIHAEEMLHDIQSRLSMAADLARLVYWDYDVATNLFRFNNQFYALYATTAEQEGGYMMSAETYTNNFVHPDDASGVVEEISRALETRDPNYIGQMEHRILRRDGEERFISVRYGIIQDKLGHTIKTFGANQDITERKRMETALEVSEKQYREMIEHQGEGICITDINEIFTFVNSAAEELFGVPRSQLVGRSPRDFVAPGQLSILEEQLLLRASGIESSYEIGIIHPDAGTLSLLITATPRFDSQHNYIGALSICRDITQRKQVEEKLRYASLHDMMTGLYNRAFFEESVNYMDYNGQFPISVIMIDVDGLKSTNDSLGHQVGDLLLQAVASILHGSTLGNDLVTRIGGDEFIILLPSTNAEHTPRVVERIEKNLARENDSHKNPFVISLSIGCCTCIVPGTLRNVIHSADINMYENKATKKRPQSK
jgi:diguanylate cyclase (GGDEF)-like protein/PAS domain S-box-containing protein